MSANMLRCPFLLHCSIQVHASGSAAIQRGAAGGPERSGGLPAVDAKPAGRKHPGHLPAGAHSCARMTQRLYV